MLGAHGEQKQVLTFKRTGDGPDVAYDFTIPGKSPKETATYLDEWAKSNGYENGFGFRTLTPEGDGTKVTVVNPSPKEGESNQDFTETENKVKQFANQHETPPSIYKGVADFIGDPASRDAALKHYSDTTRQYVGRVDGGGPEKGSAEYELDRIHRHRIWELAREAGLDVGDRPEGLPKEELEQSQNNSGVSSLQPSVEELQAAEAKIPEARQSEYEARLIAATDYLNKTITSGAYSGYPPALREQVRDIALDKLRLQLAETVGGVTKTRKGKAVKDPWMPDATNKVAKGLLDNALKQASERAGNEMAYGDVEHARSGFTDDSDTQSDTAPQAGVENTAETGTGQAYSLAEKEAVFQKIQDPATPVADKFALGRTLLDSGVLITKAERERLLKSLPDQASIKPEELQESRDIYDRFGLDDIMRGEHRDENGEIKPDEDVLRKPTATGTPQQTETKKTLLRYMDGTELVQRVLAHRDSTPLQKKIAQILLGNKALEKIPVGIFDRLTPGSEAEYDPARHTIAISREASGSELNPQTSLHEIFHALTKAFFHPDNAELLSDSQKVAVRGLKDLFKQSRSLAEEMGLTSKEKYEIFDKEPNRAYEKEEMEHYGWSSVDEFISEAMTNEDFQEQLRMIDVTNKVTGKVESAWNFFKGEIRRLLGLPKPDGSALSQAIDHILELSMSDTPIGFGENGEVLRGRAYKENEKLRAVIGKPKAYLGKTVQEKQGGIVAEPALKPFATNPLEAKRSLWALMNSDTDRFVKGRGGVVVDLRNPDPATAVKMGKPNMSPPEARVFHATGEHDNYAVPNPDKVASAPLVPQTVKQADFSGRVTLKYDRAVNATRDRSTDHQQSHFFLKVYHDPQSPTGVRWHVVLADPQGKLITQYSSPALSGVAREGTITAIGPAPAKASRAEEVSLGDTPDSAPTSTPPKAGDREKARTNAEAQGDQDEGHTEVMANGDKGNNAQGVEELKQKISGMSDDQVIQRAVELGSKQDVGSELTPEELGERQAINEDPRFGGAPAEGTLRRPATRKSQSIYNDKDNPTEYEPTTLDKIETEAGKYVKSFDTPEAALADLQKHGALVSPEAKFPAARMIQAGYEKQVADLMAKKANGETISSPELTAAQKGRDQAYRLAGEFKSKAGQALVFVKGDNQYAASTYIDTFMKSVLGGSFVELTEGKINVDALRDGMSAIKQQVADVTVDSAKKLLGVFGITEPGAIDRIKAELGDLNNDPKNFKGVLTELMGADANPEKVSALSQQLNALYNAAHARMVPSRMAELVNKTYNNLIRKGDQKALADRLATQIKQGRYDEDTLNGTLLNSLGITGYDADTVKRLRDQVNFIQSQPEGSAQRNLAADKLKGALANMEMNEMIKSGFKGKMHAAFELIPDLFRSAVLTSPATTTMHGAGGLVNTRVQAIFDAYGNFQSAMKDGASFGDACGFFKDFMDTCFVGDKGERGSPLIREAWRAVRTGTIGQGLAKGTGKRGADLHGDGVGSETFQKYCKALAIPGRLMSAWDALNAGTAQEVQQKYAMRAALLRGGADSVEIATAMKKVFAPSTEDLQAARDALDKEVNSGAFDSFTKPEQYFLKGERLEQLHKQIQLAKTGDDLVKILGSEDIQSAVERYTYKGKPMGVWGAASDLLNTLNKNSKVTTLLVPFTNIVGHLMNTSLDFTPLGALRAKNASLSNLFMPEGSKYAWPKMVEGSPEQIALMTKSIVGTAATAFITAWFLKELHDEEMTGKPPSIMFYGTGPTDPNKRQSWMASGAKADTMKIGDHYFPYKTLPAISLLGAALGAMHDMYIDESVPRAHGGKLPTPQEIAQAHQFTWDKAMRLGVALAATPLTHEYLSGLRNIITIAHDPEGPGAGKAVFSQLTGSFSQLTNPSLLRTIRNANPAAADSEGNVANLDLSTTTGKLFQFIPGYMGYNKTALNILGDPIEHKFFSPLTDRWVYSATAKPDPIIANLVNNGLYLPEARRSTPLIVDRTGTHMKVADAGDEAWRQYQIARGQFLKRVLTPDLVQRLTQIDRTQAQSILLGPSIAGASAKYAQAVVERDIIRGKIKINS